MGKLVEIIIFHLLDKFKKGLVITLRAGPRFTLYSKHKGAYFYGR